MRVPRLYLPGLNDQIRNEDSHLTRGVADEAIVDDRVSGADLVELKRQKEALNAQHKNVIAFARATRRSMKPDSHRLKLHAGVRRSERHISDLIAGIKNVGTRTRG